MRANSLIQKREADTEIPLSRTEKENVKAAELVTAVLDQRYSDEQHAKWAEIIALQRKRMSKQQRAAFEEAHAIAFWLQRKDQGPLVELLARGQVGRKGQMFLADWFNGKIKFNSGPAPRSALQRCKAWHAANELDNIKAVLAEHYPAKRITRKWAITIAALRWDISEQTLENFLGSEHWARERKRVAKLMAADAVLRCRYGVSFARKWRTYSAMLTLPSITLG